MIMKKIFSGFKVDLSENNIHIWDSYKCKKSEDIESIINEIRNDPDASKYMKRSNISYINEWAAHNLLYYMGILKDRTGDVDMNYPLKWYFNIMYFIIGNFYKIFY